MKNIEINKASFADNLTSEIVILFIYNPLKDNIN